MSSQNKIATKDQQKVEDKISSKPMATEHLEDTPVVCRAPE